MKCRFEVASFSKDIGYLVVDGGGRFVVVEDVFVSNGSIDWKMTVRTKERNALWVDVKAHKDTDLHNAAANHIRFLRPLVNWRNQEGCQEIVSDLLARGFTENDLRFGIPTYEEREAGIEHLDDEGKAILPNLLPENFALE